MTNQPIGFRQERIQSSLNIRDEFLKARRNPTLIKLGFHTQDFRVSRIYERNTCEGNSFVDLLPATRNDADLMAMACHEA